MSKDNLTKNKKRVKELGEVYTPPLLVDEMLNNIPKQLWKDKTKTFIDPSCGNGNFLVEVVKRKIKTGSSKWQALSTTFGVDIMEDNVLECRERLLETVKAKQKRFRKLVEATIVCGNTMKQDVDTLFREYQEKY
tara:strand:+ start:83 stop:487 length:405 start_codon:yes stop_codon:yes gene_type:complete